MNDKRPKTIFCDIDGTLVEHRKPSRLQSEKMKLLPGTLEKLEKWDKLGYKIILTTGRKESMRKVTEKHLSECGIFYDYLIMGIGGGKRILINDRKPDSNEDYALSINIERNVGIGDVDI